MKHGAKDHKSTANKLLTYVGICLHDAVNQRLMLSDGIFK